MDGPMAMGRPNPRSYPGPGGESMTISPAATAMEYGFDAPAVPALAGPAVETTGVPPGRPLPIPACTLDLLNCDRIPRIETE